MLPPLVEAADAILKIAEIRAGTVSAADLDIIKGDIEPDAVRHLAELIASGEDFEQARKRAVEGLDEAEAGFHIWLAKRAADAWLWAEKELAALLREAGLPPAGEQ